jgi:hypothetical protein
MFDGETKRRQMRVQCESSFISGQIQSLHMASLEALSYLCDKQALLS